MSTEQVLEAVIAEASKAILEKLRKGKKLTKEDILILYLDLMYRYMRDLRDEVKDLRREMLERLDVTYRGLSERMDVMYKELSARIDAVREELSKRINIIYSDLSGKIDGTNKRIDRLYELLASREAGRADVEGGKREVEEA